MRYVDDFKDYTLLDMANGEKLEKWGKYILIRPDPQIIWNVKTRPKLWNMAHARYIRNSSGGGHWEKLKKMDDSWKISYKNLTFNLKPMGFKHTGLFPEQAVNWDYIYKKVKEKNDKGKDVKVLNLFSYTGAASLAASAAGASVCQVDSSAGMTNWAKENFKSSNMEKNPVRFLIDDVVKFVSREIRRGNKYDAIIMDPPSYGRGKSGEVWSIEKDLFNLLNLCSQILTESPLFVIINTYTGGLSGTIIKNAATMAFSKNKVQSVNFDEIGLKMEKSDLILPCGVTTICEF